MSTYDADAAAPSEATAAESTIEQLRAALERDRTQVAQAYNVIMEAIRRRAWLREGRGSYEWDDDRWKDEFGEAIDEIKAAAEPLSKIASDWAGCPTDPAKIKAAREGAATAAAVESVTLREALSALDEIHAAVFGVRAGDEPDIYRDHDRLVEYAGRSRKALEVLRAALAAAADDGE